MPDDKPPVMIDFDAMVANNVISQKTRDKIKAYIASQKPEAKPASPAGEEPTEPTSESDFAAEEPEKGDMLAKFKEEPL